MKTQCLMAETSSDCKKCCCFCDVAACAFRCDRVEYTSCENFNAAIKSGGKVRIKERRHGLYLAWSA